MDAIIQAIYVAQSKMIEHNYGDGLVLYANKDGMRALEHLCNARLDDCFVVDDETTTRFVVCGMDVYPIDDVYVYMAICIKNRPVYCVLAFNGEPQISHGWLVK